MLLLSLLLGVSVRADNWPQWRGPNRDGVWEETGILESFPAEGLKICWRAPVGPGWSSPIVAQGRVFLTDTQLRTPQTKERERILCFEEATGKPLWTYSYEVSYPDWAYPPQQERGAELGPIATPIVEAGKLYAVGGNGQVHCLDARTGKVLWDKRLEKEYEIEVLKCRASPLIDGQRLVLFTGAKPGACVLALDKDTGKEVWKALDESVTNSSPIIITAGGKRQLIVWTGLSVTSLDPATGKTYWRERQVTDNSYAVSTPVASKDLLLIAGLMLQLDDKKPAASVLWPEAKAASRRILSYTSTALIQGDHVYSAKSSGDLVCIEARTGKEVWKTDKVTGLTQGASIHPTANGASVFLYTDQGELIRAQLTPKEYKEISRFRLLEPQYPHAGSKVAWAPPAFANGRVFARNEVELVCVDLREKRQ
jgi:outer membrane protein assembly factor BamB